MAERRSGCGRWLLGCFGLLAVMSVLCCCGGFISMRFFPMVMLSFVLEDQPLAGGLPERAPATEKIERALTCLSLSTTGSARLSPDGVARWLTSDADAHLRVLDLGATGDEATLRLSFASDQAPPRYFNVELQGHVTLEAGWFTDLRVNRLDVSGHELTSYLQGQQLASQANQSLANQRAQNPGAAELLDSVTRLTVSDGAFVVTLDPDGEAMRRLCGS